MLKEDQEERKLTTTDIKRQFEDSCKDSQKIGIEVEKIGLKADKIGAPRYRGKRGYLAVLGRLYEELGWEIVKQEGHFIMQMQRCGANMNLESDGRIELAGSAHTSLHDLVREFKIHQNEIAEVSNVFGINWLGVGYHPFSMNKELEEVPEERKIKITEYLRTVKERTGNDFGLAWFKKTAGIHVNIDYSSEKDFQRKTKVLIKLTPLLNAIFANSPFSNRKFTKHMGFRSHVVNNNGLPQFSFGEKFYSSDFSFDACIEHILEMPLLLLNKNDEWIFVENMTFGDYMEKGYKGHFATSHDLELHMKSFWKDVKMKSVIELRCLDSLPPFLVPAVPALVKGLVYNEEALKALEKMTDDWTYNEYTHLRQEVGKYALQADFKGQKLINVARDLIDLAESSLKKDRICNYFGEDESVYLSSIKDFVFGFGGSPSEWLIHQWQGKWRKSFYPAIEWWQY